MDRMWAGRCFLPLVLYTACWGTHDVPSPSAQTTRTSRRAGVDDGVVSRVLAHYSHDLDFEFRVRLRDGVEQKGSGYLRNEGLRLDFKVPSDLSPFVMDTSRIIVVADGRFYDLDFEAMEYSFGVLVSFPRILAFADSGTLRDLLIRGVTGNNTGIVRIPSRHTEVLLSNDYWIDMVRIDGNEIWLTRSSRELLDTTGFFGSADAIPTQYPTMQRRAATFPIVP